MNITSVAVYSSGDKDSLTSPADDTVSAAVSADSYLNIDNILQAALMSGADTIHRVRFYRTLVHAELKNWARYLSVTAETMEDGEQINGPPNDGKNRRACIKEATAL